MFFRSFFDENLAHMSYLIGCQKTGEALVVDPARHIAPYLETAKKEGFDISAITETHIHADYVSGSRELAKTTNAKLFLSDEGDENWKYAFADEFDHQLIKDGSHFMIGKIEMKVIHTPGHTPESLSFLLTDKGGGSDVPMGIFTGDFVFVGDVGRPDLLEKAAGVSGTAETGAASMFDSIWKFKELPDYLQVWPAHGAGSSCGKSLGAVPVTTVGYEKMNNWAFQFENKDEFAEELLKGQPEPPKYFALMKKVNKEGPEFLKEKELHKLTSVKELDEREGIQIIDLRPSESFKKKHYKGSLNIPFAKTFANWSGWLLNYDQPAILICESTQLEQAERMLESVGFDGAEAYIEPDAIEQLDQYESYEEISAAEADEKLRMNPDEYAVIDVRNDAEWEQGHILDAKHIMLGTISDRIDEIPKDKKLLVHCQSGVRSAIGMSLLQAEGFKNAINIKGGYASWENGNLPTTKGE
ncbi:MBL fold metallo-hydrolase [Metabacillus idriensis]|uniref:MBL fold metallo-hydrolase n=1 Tax=Metabacillus idriensis TaxID=324768 RepID=A0A6I2M8K3_9BACI|nr:MBL fold metallo-hydrolase [Metabacillus idriensis]MCM3598600.1 MBL fold metallo-hydrolase [Metabacillus idriensis]MRX54438.1 MBL fold metallo-hydrolase [Metabacillus idriensis]